jgi:hypothetical protein
METPYEIETDEDSVTIRLPRELADSGALTRFPDYLDMQNIRQKSQLSEDDAEALADQIKHDAWNQVRHSLKTMSRNS